MGLSAAQVRLGRVQNGPICARLAKHRIMFCSLLGMNYTLYSWNPSMLVTVTTLHPIRAGGPESPYENGYIRANGWQESPAVQVW